MHAVSGESTLLYVLAVYGLHDAEWQALRLRVWMTGPKCNHGIPLKRVCPLLQIPLQTHQSGLNSHLRHLYPCRFSHHNSPAQAAGALTQRATLKETA